MYLLTAASVTVPAVDEYPEFTAENAQAMFQRALQSASDGHYDMAITSLRTAFLRENGPSAHTKILGLRAVWNAMNRHAREALPQHLHAHLLHMNAIAVREAGRWRGRRQLSRCVETGFEKKLLKLQQQERVLGRAESLIDYLCDSDADRIDHAALGSLQALLK